MIFTIYTRDFSRKYKVNEESQSYFPDWCVRVRENNNDGFVVRRRAVWKSMFSDDEKTQRMRSFLRSLCLCFGFRIWSSDWREEDVGIRVCSSDCVLWDKVRLVTTCITTWKEPSQDYRYGRYGYYRKKR